MTSDKRSPGESFRIPSAETWNNIVNAGEYVAKLATGEPSPVLLTQVDPLRVRVRNDSGGDILAGKALEVGAKLLTTLKRESLWFEGETPSPDGTRLWGVTETAIKQDKLGDLLLGGLVVATVSVGHLAHTHVDVAASSTTLVSGFHGYPIVWKPTSTGTASCVVNLSGGYHRGPLAGKPDSTISDGGSGTVSIWLNGSDSGANETWYLDWMASESLTSGVEAVAFWYPDRQKWVVNNAGCA